MHCKHQKINPIKRPIHFLTLFLVFTPTAYTIDKQQTLDEALFFQVIHEFEDYKDVISSEDPIKIKGIWDSNQQNARITRNDNGEPVILVGGGLARLPGMTPDALLVFICHELGHFFGGAPKALRGNTTRRSWSSVEGQADFYTTSKCMPRILHAADHKANSIFSNSVNFLNEQLPAEVIEICKESDYICMRIAKASLEAAEIIASLSFEPWMPELGHKDPTEVEQTITLHPSAQCRLDTFVAGLGCIEKYSSDFDNDNPNRAACEQTEDASRPRCWFAK